MERKKNQAVEPQSVQRFSPDSATGLTVFQVEERREQGLVNLQALPRSKTVGQIIRDNIFTLFNLMNVVLALLVLMVGSYQNMLFMGVVISNIVIGIVQEIRAKQTIDRLCVISAPHADVIRDAKSAQIGVEELVLDDIMTLGAGKQICADAVIQCGRLEVNESLLTGESEPVFKGPGDLLYSGSFVVSGTCKAKVEHVGRENYASKITADAKQRKKAHSDLMDALNKIIRVVSIVIIPVGILLFSKQFFFGGENFSRVVVTTVAALIGMIPEGLILLTSMALAVGVIRLAARKTLVQELYCIETLARVDTLCLDKTGTITEGTMRVVGQESLGTGIEIRQAVSELAAALQDDNATFLALREEFHLPAQWRAEKTVAFSSARKWSGATFTGQGSYLIGAPEFLLPGRYAEIRPRVEAYSGQGNRVLLLAHSAEPLVGETLPAGVEPAGLILLADKIRPEAAETLRFFAEQGVALKVISGDNPLTVSQVALSAGLEGAQRYVDATTLTDEASIDQAVKDYVVFGRVTPQQKRQFVKALKAQGHTVAMTGDGVNDVLALKDADCSVAMASGSEAARNVAQLVLLDSNFASMPHVVMEGRRVINNIQRASSLFLVKTIFSFLLSILLIFIPFSYPFMPIHLTLISGLTIGIPSFFLALEPNRARMRGRFLSNVLKRALPGALTVVCNLLGVMGFGRMLGLTPEQISTVSVFATAVVSYIVLFQVCMPFNLLRKILYACMVVGFVGAVLLLGGLFMIAPWTLGMFLLWLPVALLSFPLIWFFSWVLVKAGVTDAADVRVD